jgi:hypothetical protein
VAAVDLKPLYSYDMTFAAFMKATDTRIPQEVPANSNEHQLVENAGAAGRGFKVYWNNILTKSPGPGKTMEDYQKLWAGVPVKPYTPGKTAAAAPASKLASAAPE